MTAPPSGISKADWLRLPADARTFILAQQQEIRAQREEIRVLRHENEQMLQQLSALAAELPGSGPELLPVERCEESHDHLPDTCRRCGPSWPMTVWSPPTMARNVPCALP
jgi:hypothetical protein